MMEFKYEGALVSKTVFKQSHKKLMSYIQEVKEKVENNQLVPEAFLTIADENIDQIQALKNTLVSQKLKYIFVIGIGGSNLGTKAIYDALYGFFDVIYAQQFPKLIFFDTINPSWLFHIKHLLEQIQNPEEVIINIISKSGNTTETIANASYLVDLLRKKSQEFEKRIVVISEVNSSLSQWAKEHTWEVLEHPSHIGGRFSVFSPVSLFPLLCIGADIFSFLKGAKAMQSLCLSEKGEENMALFSASVLEFYYHQERKIHISFFFHSELESLGKWYQQLLAESIGKEKNINDDVVHIGITPLTSIGSTDLHSLGQLYLGGPKDKVTTFISAKKTKDVKIEGEFTQLIPALHNKGGEEILKSILGGVKNAYKKQKLPFMEVNMSNISEESLGQFMAFKMMEVIFLAKLFQVNAFDQPSVELYKVETKKLLQK